MNGLPDLSVLPYSPNGLPDLNSVLADTAIGLPDTLNALPDIFDELQA